MVVTRFSALLSVATECTLPLRGSTPRGPRSPRSEPAYAWSPHPWSRMAITSPCAVVTRPQSGSEASAGLWILGEGGLDVPEGGVARGHDVDNGRAA